MGGGRAARRRRITSIRVRAGRLSRLGRDAHRDELGSVEAEFLAASEQQEHETGENERSAGARRTEAESERRQKRLGRWLLAAARRHCSPSRSTGLAVWAQPGRGAAKRRGQAGRLAANCRPIGRGEGPTWTGARPGRRGTPDRDTDEARTSLFDCRAKRRRWHRCASLRSTGGHARAVAFSPDGKTLAAGYGMPATVGRGGAVGRGAAAPSWPRCRW